MREGTIKSSPNNCSIAGSFKAGDDLRGVEGDLLGGGAEHVGERQDGQHPQHEAHLPARRSESV